MATIQITDVDALRFSDLESMMLKKQSLCLLLICLLPSASFGLEPKEILILINKNVPQSHQIALYYCEKRAVPKDNILSLELPKTEDITRADYEKALARPVREKLKKCNGIKVLLTTYGIPLRVGSQIPTIKEKATLDILRPERNELRKERAMLTAEIRKLQEQSKAAPSKTLSEKIKDLKAKQAKLNNRLRPLDAQWRRLSHSESKASVDSELSMVRRANYPLDRWQRNDFYWQLAGKVRSPGEPLIMVARLDGPSPKLVKRLIDDAIAAEKNGLEGIAYVDARGIKHAKGASRHGYSGYDQSLRDMAKLLEEKANLKVKLDNKNALFPSNSCKQCSLYCGWYSHARFVDCCELVQGAIAYHIASSEAVSLRRPGAKYWCKNLLENGAAVTLGPVAEPYTIGFPKPAEFFALLLTGEHTLVECYWKSQLLTSWMMVLIGDPLYNPFKKAPKLKPSDLKPSPPVG